MSERKTELIAPTADLFEALSRLAHGGVLVETTRRIKLNGAWRETVVSSSYEFRGNYQIGDQIRPIALSYSRFIGSENIEVSSEDFEGQVVRVDQANTSHFNEHLVTGIPSTFQEALGTIQPDAEAMGKLSPPPTDN